MVKDGVVDNGNGKKVAVIEVEIRQLSEAIGEQTKLLNDIFGPKGLCFQKHKEVDTAHTDHDKKISVLAAQTKWQWVAISGTGGVLGYLFRLFIEHVQA